MRKILSKMLIIALFVTMMPVQAFALSNNDPDSNSGASTQSGGSILVNADPISSAYCTSTGQTFTKPITVDLLIRGNVASKTGQTNTAGLATQYHKLLRVAATYNVTGAIRSSGSTPLIKKSGTEYRNTLRVALTVPGVYYLTGKIVAYYEGVKKPYTKSFSIKLTVSPTPAVPGCSISGPASGTVGKAYSYTGSDWVNTAGATIKSRTWKVTNSTAPKLTQSGKTATFSTNTPSPYYTLRYTVVDSTGKTAFAEKTINIANIGPIISLTATTPLSSSQLGNVVMTVDTKGLTLDYSWKKEYVDLQLQKHTSFGNGIDFTPPVPGRSGTFKSVIPGEYTLTVTATDKASGKPYSATAKIQVVGPLQAAISANSPVAKGSTCKAKDISIVKAPATLKDAQWTVKDPNGKTTPYTTAPGGSISIDTSILGTHAVYLTATDSANNKSAASKMIKVVETLPLVETTELSPLIPGNVQDLLNFDDIIVPDAASSKKHMLDISERGLSGNCINSASKQNHIGEINSAFQYWKLTVNLSEYNAAGAPILTNINKDKIVANGNSKEIVVTFQKVGIYQVYASKWYYCETNGRYTHKVACTHTPKHTNPHTHCSFLQYKNGAIIEKHGDIGPYRVVITADQVGVPVTFSAEWAQETIKTESYLIQ